MTEAESHLLVERRDGIMILTMNRPEVKNSLSPQMLVKLAAAWHEFRDSKDLRAAILTGAGDEDFCAGGDLQLTMPLITGARKPEDEWDEKLMGDLQQFLDAILRGFELYKPVIAAVNGRALGGGTELTNAVDLRVAAEHAIFGTPEAQVGLLPGGGSLTRLPRQIPYCKADGDADARRLVQRPGGARDGPPELRRAREQLMDKAFELAAGWPRTGPLAVQKVKEGIMRSSGLPLDRAYQVENEVSAAVMQSKRRARGPARVQGEARAETSPENE